MRPIVEIIDEEYLYNIGSRYRDYSDYKINGTFFLETVDKLNLPVDEREEVYQIPLEEDRRPDLTARNFYSNSKLWWAIALYNNMADPILNWKAGEIIRVPTSGYVIERLLNI